MAVADGGARLQCMNSESMPSGGSGRTRRLGLSGVVALGCLLLAGAGPAQAFIIDLDFVPESLVENRSVEFEAEYWGCAGPFPNVDGLEFEVRRDGSVIDFYYSTMDSPCGVPPPGPVVTYSLGFLAEGDYMLRHVRVFNTQPFPQSMDGLDPVVVPFSVGPVVAEPIPALGGWSYAILLLLIAGLAAQRLAAAGID